MRVEKDGRSWLVGTQADVAWLALRPGGLSIETAVPPFFEAYATLYPPEESLPEPVHEQAVLDVLTAHTPEQPWWLGFLDTGAHDVVFPAAPRVSLYFGWPYVLVEGDARAAGSWRTGHMRSSDGHLPDLLFPEDRSWLVSALWDDTWGCVGGSELLVSALEAQPLAGARRVSCTEDMKPPRAVRD